MHSEQMIPKEDATRFDLKRGAGGIVDIKFIVPVFALARARNAELAAAT